MTTVLRSRTVRVDVPTLGEVRVAASRSDSALARRLLLALESSTGGGRPSDTLSSLGQARDELLTALHQYRETKPVSSRRVPVPVLGLRVITAHLRPFLSKWVSRYRSWRESAPDLDEADWADEPAFTADLERLREALGQFTNAFARVAGYTVTDIDEMGLTHRS